METDAAAVAGPDTFAGVLNRLHRAGEAAHLWDLLVPGTWLGNLVECEAAKYHRRCRVPEPPEAFVTDVRHEVHDRVLPRLAGKLRRLKPVRTGYAFECVKYACRTVAGSKNGTASRVILTGTLGEGYEESIVDPAERPDEVGARKDLWERVYAAIGGLDETAQDVLLILIDANWNQTEAARRAGLTRDRVRSIVGRSLKLLRRVLGEDNGPG
jgi:hypothetical protein